MRTEPSRKAPWAAFTPLGLPWTPIPYPLRKHPFFALRRRTSRMLGPWVRPSRSIDVAEHQCIAGLPAMTDPQARETCFPALEALVEVDEDRCHALAIARDLLAELLRVEKIAVQDKFLPDVIMQHLCDLEAEQRRAELVGDPLPDHVDDHV